MDFLSTDKEKLRTEKDSSLFSMAHIPNVSLFKDSSLFSMAHIPNVSLFKDTPCFHLYALTSCESNKSLRLVRSHALKMTSHCLTGRGWWLCDDSTIILVTKRLTMGYIGESKNYRKHCDVIYGWHHSTSVSSK